MSCTQKSSSNESRSFLIDNESAVYDSLLGTAFAYKNLVVLEDHNIIMRRDHTQMTGRVKILAGGGAGLEPGDVGFIGQGMLTAAILGGVLVAPPANSVLIAIRELAFEHPDGILLLVKNYLGDQLNFGLAFERAINEHINIKMLLIGDDSSNPETGKYGRRGHAGCVLVYKIAGAMAEAGKSLDDIFKVCREQLLTDLSTVSMCLSLSDHLKWGYNVKSVALSEDEAVIGIGLYGQPGLKVKYNDWSDIIKQMIAITSESLNTGTTPDNVDETPIVVLINNLGATSYIEEGVICRQIIKELESQKFSIVRLYRGTFMPLMDSKGFSITLLKVTDPQTLKFLDAPTFAFNWPKSVFQKPEFNPVPPSGMVTVNEIADLPTTVQPKYNHEDLNDRMYMDMSFGPSVSATEKVNHRLIISIAAEALISCEKRINVIDLEVGDGDTGTMLKNCAVAIEDALEEEQINLVHPFKMLQDVSRAFERTVGGVTGALYSIFFRSGSKAFLNAPLANREAWCSALKSGVKGVQHYGRAELGERTFLDVLLPAVEVFELANRKRDSIYRTACNVACTCEYHAEESKKVKPIDVRGSLPRNVLVYPDAGAHAAAIWIRAVCEGVKLKYPEE